MTHQELQEALQPIAEAINNLARAVKESGRSGGGGHQKSSSGGGASGGGSRREKAPDTTTPEGEWSNFVVNFGKHSGKRLSEIPEDYLEWLVGQAQKGEIRNDDLDAALHNYYTLKSGSAPKGKPAASDKPAPSGGPITDDEDIPF